MVGYRSDIDGLRAVSVLLVLGFHLGVPSFGGGFVGVDVFFVISGYLITCMIRDAINEGRFSLWWFYERRCRRILPALLTVIAITAAFGYLLLMPGDYEAFGRSAVAAATALSNLFFLHNTGYFDAPGASMPLLHTWSLAVEEQFYLVWPAVMLGAAKLIGKSRLAWCAMLLAIIAASLAAAAYEASFDPKAAFYLPHTRAWELALGGLLVFVAPIRSRWIAELRVIVGLICIIAAVTLSAAHPFPTFAFLPAVGAALVVCPSAATSSVASVLGSAVPAFLGRISYSLYLVHWAMIVLVRQYLNGDPLSTGGAAAVAGASVILAIVSWRYVEQPFRRATLGSRSAIGIALAASAALACALSPIVLARGFPIRIAPQMAALASIGIMWEWKCPQYLDIGLLPYPDRSSGPTCIVGPSWQTATHHALVWGDSNAEAILPLLNVAARRANTSAALVNRCATVIGGAFQVHFPLAPTHNSYCIESRKAALRLLSSNSPSIDLVVIASSWTILPEYLVRAGSNEHSRSLGLGLLREGLDELIPQIEAPSRRVVLFADVPKWPVAPIPCVLAGSGLLRRPCGFDACSIARADVDRYEKPVHDVLRQAAAAHGVISYSPEDYLCGSSSCPTYFSGEFLYMDGDHLRRNLSPSTVEGLVDAMELSRLFDAKP
jgi:peptidoglycan/LPS O-acetylase OafA/YrhL